MARRGKVVQYILDKFDEDPKGAWLVSDLTTGYYDTKSPTKSHRVAMLRAMRRVVELEPRCAIAGRARLSIYDATNVFSSQAGQYMAWREWWADSVSVFMGKNVDDRKKGGRIYNDVALHKARLAGDDELAGSLEVEIENAKEERMKKAKAIFTKPTPPPPSYDGLKTAAGAAVYRLLTEYPDECEAEGNIQFDLDGKPLFKIVRITEDK